MHPRAVVSRERALLARGERSLETSFRALLERRGGQLERASVRLDALSPLKVLGRGYAIATREDGRAVRCADDVAPGGVVRLRVAEARIEARVERIEPLLPRGKTP
jgi:exodeoxyribonuclease VII large subunit